MKFSIVTKIFIASAVLISVFGFNRDLFSWGLFNFFTDTDFSDEGLEKVADFDPDRDILYLPELGNKGFFESIDDLSICRRKDVRKFIYIYLTRGREFTIRGIERRLLYRDIVDSVFGKNPDIPADLACLPLLESGYNPYAVSRSKAVGLWQFVSNTSNPLGLKNNMWVDDRRDLEKSTEAAIRHLRGLYNTFGSWDLALAAYNGGGGHVRRSMNRTNTPDFWNLQKSGALRTETSEYVPRFAALLLIYKNQKLFGISEEIEHPELPETDTIVLRHSVPIKEVARYSDTDINTIRRFNPELRRHITPPDRKSYTLRLPLEGVQKLEENIQDLYKYRRRKLRAYRVKKGDSLSGIARQNNKKTSDLLRFNDIKNPDRIQPGRVIYIPY